MAKGPGLYTDIGKKARDLLYRDYQNDQKFSLTTYTATGVAITSSGTKKGEQFFADLNTQVKTNNITTDIKVDTSSRIFTTITFDELAPGLKTICSFALPDQRSGKVELQYQHDYTGICASMGLTANPVFNLSGVLGSNVLGLGTDLSYDTATATVTKFNTGFNFANSDFIASLMLNDKGDNLVASYYHSPRIGSSFGTEIGHRFSTNENTMTFGAQYTLDPLTTVKGRFNSSGKANALIQHEWRPRSLVTISGEVDTRAIDKSPKLGLALALKS